MVNGSCQGGPRTVGAERVDLGREGLVLLQALTARVSQSDLGCGRAGRSTAAPSASAVIRPFSTNAVRRVQGDLAAGASGSRTPSCAPARRWPTRAAKGPSQPSRGQVKLGTGGDHSELRQPPGRPSSGPSDSRLTLGVISRCACAQSAWTSAPPGMSKRMPLNAIA
jgi:hypothetical protein